MCGENDKSWLDINIDTPCLAIMRFDMLILETGLLV